MSDDECDDIAARAYGEYAKAGRPSNRIVLERLIIRAAHAAGMRAGIERAAGVCDAIASDKWDQYKGREPYEPMNPNRANPQTQGESDGAAICAGALRTLLVGK